MGHSSIPSPWVLRFGSRVPRSARVLDLACGAGRHTRWALATGHTVTAVDRDLAGIEDLDDPNLERVCADLEDGSPWPLAGRVFDLVVVTNYLHRPLFPHLVDSLGPGGVLLYETFAAGNEVFGRPRRPAFLLNPGELLTACAELQVVAFEQGEVARPQPAVIQRICAVRPASDSSSWPPCLPGY